MSMAVIIAGLLGLGWLVALFLAVRSALKNREELDIAVRKSRAALTDSVLSGEPFSSERLSEHLIDEICREFDTKRRQ